jgi:16S rRNA (cytosine1402-N4)-methyltransferase
MESQKQTVVFHIPVLVESVIQHLIVNSNGIFVDATIGGAGHSEAILQALSRNAILVGIDGDADAIRYSQKKLKKFPQKVHLVHGYFDEIDSILNDLNIKQIDGLFFDLGISSHQIDESERGFSYLQDGPLDMRMNRLAEKKASDVINRYSENKLADIFYLYGEERYSRSIARRIIEARKKQPIERTLALSRIVSQGTPERFQIKTLSRIWQALRFEVNDELGRLERSLKRAVPYLSSGARIVAISWESLMDRMVKRFLKGQSPTFTKGYTQKDQTGIQFDILTKKVVCPSREEIKKNPRARSAKLRAGQKK